MEVQNIVNKLLIVAEKPSVARAITRAFSISKKLKFTKRKGSIRYNAIFETILDSEIEYVIGEEKTKRNLRKDDILIVTSVTGHAMNFDYPPPFDKKTDWHKSNPMDLVKLDPLLLTTNEKLANQLKVLGKEADVLTIATDWDSHGESIGGEIVNLCQFNGKNVGRMRFVSTSPNALINSFINQVEIDNNLIASVDSLRTQDLRMGASVTRFLTVELQNVDDKLRNLISYGPCQSSVLWIISTRYNEINNFKAEPYCLIRAIHNYSQSKEQFIFTLSQDKIFDLDKAQKIFDEIKEEKKGLIEDIQSETQVIKRPSPLDTDTLESECSRIFRASPKKIADLAERLYNQGIITYPRTESSYYLQKDLTPLVEVFVESKEYGSIAKSLIDKGTPKSPSKGKFSRDHEPIRPVKAIEIEEIEKKLSGFDIKLAWNIYDYIVKRFLATVSEEGELSINNIILKVKNYQFNGKSQVITKKGFLEHYPFKYIEEKELPSFNKGSEIEVSVEKNDLETQPPPLWTESRLIREMSRHGIGTDATRSSHIATVNYRRYVKIVSRNRALAPTEMGLTLFNMLNTYASELIHPSIRNKVEEWTKKVYETEMTPKDVDKEVISLTLNSLKNLQDNKNIIFENLAESIRISTGSGMVLGTCAKCSSNLILRSSAKSKRYLECENKDCAVTYPLPKKGALKRLKGYCQICKTIHPLKVGSGTKTWTFCPKCWVEKASESAPLFCSTCEEDCMYAEGTIIRKLKEILPEEIENFPVGQGISVLSGKTLVKTGTWKKAILLVKIGNKKQLRLYGWQKNKEGIWKLRQKFNLPRGEFSAELTTILHAFSNYNNDK